MLIIIPQAWADHYAPLPDRWLEQHAPGLLRAAPHIGKLITEAAMTAGVDERLLATRMQLEQSAITYAWDGSTRDYGGGAAGDAAKLRYLCGVDRTDSGDRAGGEPEVVHRGRLPRRIEVYRGLLIDREARREELRDAVEHEDYERAAQIRDRMNDREIGDSDRA